MARKSVRSHSARKNTGRNPARRDPSMLRSRQWFANPDNPDMTALYIERYMNWGLSREELQSGKPIIGIAQSGSDLSPCNRHHLDLAKRTREGIREAGGIPFEFPVHPIQETGKRPGAALDRNLSYLGLVELLLDRGDHVLAGQTEHPAAAGLLHDRAVLTAHHQRPCCGIPRTCRVPALISLHPCVQIESF